MPGEKTATVQRRGPQQPVCEGGSVCKDVSHPRLCQNTLGGELRVKENHDLLTEWEINPPLATPQALLSHVKQSKWVSLGNTQIKGIAGQNKLQALKITSNSK